jgi:hypothetical protein
MISFIKTFRGVFVALILILAVFVCRMAREDE